MSRNNHPVEQEELMAYLDGELATDRAVEAAAHLERCAECQEFAAELRKISQEMMGWEVEPPEPRGIPSEIAVMLTEPREPRPRNKQWQMWGILVTPRRLAGIGAVTVLILAIAIPNVLRSRYSAKQGFQVAHKYYDPEYGRNSGGLVGTVPKSGPANANKSVNGDIAADYAYSPGEAGKVPKSNFDGEKARGYQDVGENEESHEIPAVPMIARTAGLALVAQDFEKTRAALEEILKRHNGYVDEMNVSAPSDAGRILTATLRVPAPQLDAALSELKKLGRVEGESQGGEEVTAQYVDLEARLKNAQHTEQRLTEILRSRTGKLQDVLKVELEIDRVRGEIEQMQAEKKELTKRVAFSTVNATIKEEYQAKLQTAPPSTGSRFHNAAVDGYNSVVEGLINVGLFLLSAGPSLLIWAAILFFPIRWAWRKVRAELKKNRESAS